MLQQQRVDIIMLAAAGSHGTGKGACACGGTVNRRAGTEPCGTCASEALGPGRLGEPDVVLHGSSHGESGGSSGQPGEPEQ